MSIVSSLVLVLLCFSFHACNSRSFGVVHKETANAIHHSISINKKNAGLDPARVSSIPNAYEDVKKEIIFDERKVIKSESNEQKGTEVSGTTKSTEYVSWRVTPKKREEQEPGFNLDYLPPKTHPPVHN